MTYKLTYIGNLTLTTSLQAVTIPTNTNISRILMSTQDGTAFEIGLESDSTDTFKFDYDYGSAPLTFPFGVDTDDSRTIFYVKGTAGSTFQFIAFLDMA